MRHTATRFNSLPYNDRRMVTTRESLRKFAGDTVRDRFIWLAVAFVLISPVLHPAAIYLYLRAVSTSDSLLLPVAVAIGLALTSLTFWILFFRQIVLQARARRRGELVYFSHRNAVLAHIALLLVIAPAAAASISADMMEYRTRTHIVTRSSQIDKLTGSSLLRFVARFSGH